ncbi:beta-lactamase family protein [Aliiglaciecola sp. M165]|nr:beta-lactamase family protein [Aliiglaciecola sp. M165]
MFHFTNNMRSNVSLLCTFLAALLLPTFLYGQTEPSMKQLIQHYSDDVPKLMETSHVPGISLALFDKNKVLWHQNWGVSNTEKHSAIETNMMFEAASLSKPVFAAIVLRLASRGEFSLDQPLHTILPFTRATDQSLAKQLTARVILSHQTGLPNWGGEYIDFIESPKTSFHYSGEGYVYLQKVLEKMTGKSLQELAESEIFDVVGMKNSQFTWTPNERINRITGHDRLSNPMNRGIPEANAASSLHTTSRDYAKFVMAWFKGTLFDADLIAQAQSPEILITGDERNAKLPLPNGSRLAWTLGWGLQQQNNHVISWHWGDNGVFKAFVAWNSWTNRGMVYFSNSENGLSIAKKLVEPVVGNMANTFHFLNYTQSDNKIWHLEHAALLALKNKHWQEAQSYYQKMQSRSPNNDQIARRITWLQERIRVLNESFVLSEENRNCIVGQYGPRQIKWENGRLYYQRRGNQPHKLLPISATQFLVGDLTDFKISFSTDEKGICNAIVGHYISGEQDRSPRSTTRH